MAPTRGFDAELAQLEALRDADPTCPSAHHWNWYLFSAASAAAPS